MYKNLILASAISCAGGCGYILTDARTLTPDTFLEVVKGLSMVILSVGTGIVSGVLFELYKDES